MMGNSPTEKLKRRVFEYEGYVRDMTMLRALLKKGESFAHCIPGPWTWLRLFFTRTSYHSWNESDGYSSFAYKVLGRDIYVVGYQFYKNAWLMDDKHPSKL